MATTLDFTFEGIRKLMEDRLKLQSDSKDILFHSVYQRIIDTVAFANEKNAYQAQFYFRESSFERALTRSSLTNQSFVLDYFPSRRTGAFGELALFALNQNFVFPFGPTTYTGESVVIPAKTRFATSDGTGTLYSTEQAVYSKNTVVSNKLISNAAAVNKGSGLVGIPVTNHGMPAGAFVTLSGTTNYEGSFTIDAATTTNEVVIQDTYVAETFQGDEKIFTGHVLVPVKEGNPRSFTYVSEGIANETFSILSDAVDDNEVTINIVDENDVVLFPVSIVDKPFFVNDIAVYSAEVLNTPDFASILVRFGENIFTRQLTLNERVRVDYIDTQGLPGNVEGINAITVIIDTLLDAFQNEAVLYVRNIEPISDGQNFESLASIRNNARRLFFAGRQLISSNDWKAIIESHPSIAKAIVWSVADLSIPTTGSNNNIVFISAVTNSGDGLTTAQETDISTNFLIPKKSPTDIISWERLQAIFVKFDITAVVKNVPFTQVQAEINTALNTEYDILNIEFAIDAFESNYVRIIDSVSNVIHHVTIPWYVEANVGFQASLQTIQVSLLAAVQPVLEKQILLSNNQAQLWIKRKIAGVFQAPVQIAQAVGAVFTELNDYRMGASAVIYASNQLSWQLQDLTDDTPPDGTAASFRIDLGSPTVTGATLLAAPLTGTVYNTAVTGVVIDTISFTPSGTETDIDDVVTTLGTAVGATEKWSAVLVLGTGGANAYIQITMGRVGANTMVTTLAAFYTNLGTQITQTVTETINLAGIPLTSTFGVQNPTETDNDGFILYLMYRTQDGNGATTRDIRLRDFNQILDFDDALTEFSLDYKNA